jgi:hypothetical protein
MPHADFKSYTVKINGELVTEPVELHPGDRLLFGSHIYYIYIHPNVNKDATFDYEEAVKEANKEQMQFSVEDDKAQKELEEMKKKLKEDAERQQKLIEAQMAQLEADRKK